MKLINLKKVAAGFALGLIAILGTSLATSAQGNRNHEKQAQKRQEKIDKQRAKFDQQRQSDWTRRNTQVVTYRNNRVAGNTYYTVEPTVNVTEGRYRIYRSGSYYNTDNRGVDMLRQAVNEGYRRGFAAGRSDYGGRRNYSWSNSNDYRSGTYGYQNGVTRSQYQYYFRQGFQRGYQDGSNSRYQDGYDGDYQYGYNNGGSLNILGTILNQILNIQSY